jgi:nicotinamidase/pyrazinamidase
MGTIAIDPARDVLIIVDLQNDFCPGGALAVPDGHEIIPLINPLLRHRWFSVATKDWHPADHCSFTHQGGPWPPHCVQQTSGAELHPALETTSIQLVIAKGAQRDKEAYSGFQDTELTKILRERGVKRIVLCGLATDYCVRATALDALREGFEVVVLEDAIRGVDVMPGDCQRALEELRQRGAQLVASADLTFDERQ